MNKSKHTKKAKLFTTLVLEIFRVNGILISVGDELTKDLGLTSALWQVLGAIQEKPLPMAQIARNMGLSRQGVRRSTNILINKGLVKFEENPDHKRAKLIVPTAKGKKAISRLEKIQTGWSNSVSDDLSETDLEKVIDTIKVLSEKL